MCVVLGTVVVSIDGMSSSREVSVMVSPLKAQVYMPINREIWWKTRVIRQAVYKALISSYQTAGEGDVQPQRSVVQRLNRAITRCRDTAHGEICGALGRLSKWASNYQNSNAILKECST